MRTDNPILIEVHRAARLESLHRGAWVITNTSGDVVDHMGEPDQAIFPRSATKSLQALPLVETGAADRFGFDDRHLALAIASHSGEPRHTEVVLDGLAKIGLDPHHLRCGADRPVHSSPDAPTNRVTHNCSGKHLGFLAVAMHLGADPSTYLDPDSEVQMLVQSAVADMAGLSTGELGVGVDGCSAPTFHLPMSGLATALARVTNPQQLTPARAAACQRLTDAARHHPDLVAGTHERFCTDVIAATNGRVFAKIGAEGVYAFGVVEHDIGFAGKVDDGNARGLYAVMVDLLVRRELIDEFEAKTLDHWGRTSMRNRDGIDVGHIIVRR